MLILKKKYIQLINNHVKIIVKNVLKTILYILIL